MVHPISSAPRGRCTVREGTVCGPCPSFISSTKLWSAVFTSPRFSRRDSSSLAWLSKPVTASAAREGVRQCCRVPAWRGCRSLCHTRCTQSAVHRGKVHGMGSALCAGPLVEASERHVERLALVVARAAHRRADHRRHLLQQASKQYWHTTVRLRTSEPTPQCARGNPPASAAWRASRCRSSASARLLPASP